MEELITKEQAFQALRAGDATAKRMLKLVLDMNVKATVSDLYKDEMLRECCKQAYLYSAKLLLAKGASLWRRDPAGNDCLHEAVIHEQFVMVKWIVESEDKRAGVGEQVDLDYSNGEGYTAIDLAYEQEGESLDMREIRKFLKAKGASPSY